MAIWMKIGGISTCVDNGSPIVYGWITNKVEITAFRDGDKIIGTSAMARFIHKELPVPQARLQCVGLHVPHR